ARTSSVPLPITRTAVIAHPSGSTRQLGPAALAFYLPNRGQHRSKGRLVSDQPPTVGVRDVAPSYTVFAGAVSYGGYLIEEWTDHGGSIGLAAGIAWICCGTGAAVLFAVRWWQMTHKPGP